MSQDLKLYKATDVDATFTKALPKIELHAHISGSITRQSLNEIWQKVKIEEPDFALEDPLVTIPPGDYDIDIDSFFPLFSKCIYQLCDTKERIQYATASVLRDFQQDGVVYLELRTIPRPCKDLTKDGYVSTVLDVFDTHGHDVMSTYLILSIDRKHTAAEAMEVADLAIKYQSRGVVGLDVCGNPTKGDVSHYREAFAKAKQHGLKVTLHFAEVPASSTEEELQTLLSYHPERLGHVINVPDSIKEEITKRKLGLELCLTCNVNAKLISGTFADHHFGYWRDKGCPLIICTDDVGIFRSPLSNEYLLLARHFGLNRLDLIELCQGALTTIFGPEFEKAKFRGTINRFKAMNGLDI